MNKINPCIFGNILLVVLLLSSSVAMAAETLDSVLAMAAEKKDVAVDYREVRHIRLLKKPWQAAGHMYIQSDLFVMEQNKPRRQLLVSRGVMFWLYVPEKHFRRTGFISSATAQRSFALFRPIMQGDREALEKAFDIKFAANDRGWKLELQPKETENARYSRILVEGKNNHAADFMRADMVDGDYTEWFLDQRADTAGIDAEIARLLTEAKGH